MTSPNPALRELAVLLQLGRRAREASSLEALGFIMVNETRQLFDFRQAALAQPRFHGMLFENGVMAVSGLPQPDPQAPYVQWLGRLFAQLAKQFETETPVSFGAADLPEIIAREWSAWLPEHALLLPLGKPGGRRLSYLLLARDTPWEEHELAMAAELAHAYGHALAGYAPVVPLRERLRNAVMPRKQRVRLLLALLVVCAFPVRLTVLAPAEVVPTDPFLVRAPLDGVIDRFHVAPNQLVKQGDALFDLDTTTQRSRFGIARKAYEVAQEEYRQAAQLAVTDEKSKTDIAAKKGNLDEKALELNYSKDMLDRVRIKAARTGVAVFADVNDWQGKAVAIGERVLLLADPAKVELSVSLPVSEAIDLPKDAAITLYPNGSALTSYDAELTSAAYRAEPMPGGVLAYRLKAKFTGNDTPPRIGLMGTAKVHGGRVPLIYYVLRRPLASARQRLGW
jgi:hypothetical protein